MIAAHEKLTNEAGETFVLLPLEEYNALLDIYPEDDEELTEETKQAIKEDLADLANNDVVSAEEIQEQLGLPKYFPVQIALSK